MHTRTLSARFLLIIAAAALTAGCGASPAQPTPPGDPKTESFDGTIRPGELLAYSFTVDNAGELSVTLASWGGSPDAGMGLAIGSWDAQASRCNEELSSHSAKLNTVLTGNPQQPGTYCATIYDVGNLGSPAEFTLLVKHH